MRAWSIVYKVVIVYGEVYIIIVYEMVVIWFGAL